jgi:hypothetical protein
VERRSLIVGVGEVTAKCRSCGKTEFTPVLAGPLRLASVLVCEGCKTSATYRELRDQLGEEAVRRAKDSVDAFRRNTGRPPKPRK